MLRCYKVVNRNVSFLKKSYTKKLEGFVYLEQHQRGKIDSVLVFFIL